MHRFRTFLFATTALIPLGLLPAAANPLGPQVVGGNATVQGQGTATVTVTQQSNSAIINWNTFNIGAGEKTNIVMPSANSVQLDRVTGGLGPSQILGSLWSNGRVFLVNPDGILFGSGAKVDAAGFLATTNDIANADFMAGRYSFSVPGNPGASIVNQGTITAQTGGFAALVAPGVRNAGTITAKLGTIALASGNEFTLDFYGDKLITLGLSDSIAATVTDVATGQPLKSLVENDGKLKANGGSVALTAVAARQVVDSVINNSGVIEANTIGKHNGMIVLGAATAAAKPAGAPTQTVKVSGTLSAAGKKNRTIGGTIEVTGEAIEVTGAKIDASGAAGGGAVLIGGDWGGGNPNTSLISNPSAFLESYAVPNASSVSVDAATTINASAKNAGNGGKVIVWSNGVTSFGGSILVQGGTQSGDGGFVETSGHQLSFNGNVNTSAPNGVNGTLLLDPLNATIAAIAGSEVITTSSIENALASGDVVVTTVGTTGSEAGDITVASSLNWANANTLTLNAYSNIGINNGVTIANTGAGNLVLHADATGTGAGTVNFLGSGNVDFSGSTGTVSIYYNSPDNPAGSVVNPTSYTSPIDYSGSVFTNSAVPNQLTAYMLINSVYDLQNMNNNLSGSYALGKNIDATVTSGWNAGTGFLPIGDGNAVTFSGMFNGLGYSILNLTINRPSRAYVGLFGAVTYAIVQNVSLTGGSINGQIFVGALAGYALNSTISDISSNLPVTGDTTGGVTSQFGTAVGGLVGALEYFNYGVPASASISNSSATGQVIGYNMTGGLVGVNYNGMIDKSYATGTVTGTQNYIGGLVGLNGDNTVPYIGANSAITNSYATGSVSGILSVGGLAGSNRGTIATSYATGNVVGQQYVGGLVGDNGGGSISKSYAAGSVSGDTFVGGLVGINIYSGNLGSYYAGSISDTYATGAVTGNSFVGGLVGGNQGYFGQTGTISDSYSTGPVSGTTDVGGLAGYIVGTFASDGTAINSYWDTQSSNMPTSPTGTPLTTAQLKASLPTGFDPTVWAINPSINNGYPHLLWTMTNTPPVVTTTFMPTLASSSSPTTPPTTTTDIFGTGQTNFFYNPINTQVAVSTPTAIFNPQPFSLPDLPTLSPVQQATIVFGSGIFGGPATVETTEVATSIYGDLADAYNTLNDAIQGKGTSVVANDVTSDSLDILNVPLSLAPGVSESVNEIENLSVAATENVLSSIFFDLFYK